MDLNTVEAIDLSPTIGVELRGLDLTRPLTGAELEVVDEQFRRQHLILVRDTNLSREDLARFVGLFGPIVKNADGLPLITVVSNVSDEDITGGGQLLFHQDEVTLASDLEGIPRAISMYAVDVSDDAVPTLFADAVRVFDELPTELRERLSNSTAVHILDRDPERDYSHKTFEGDLPPGADPERYRRSEHPVFYPLDEGRYVVFVTQHQTSHIVGMTRDESEQTLAAIFELLYAKDNQYEHHWRTGDLIVWNNRALHHARPVRGQARRHMLRVSVGPTSYYQTN